MRCYPRYQDNTIAAGYDFTNRTASLSTHLEVIPELPIITDLDWRIPRHGNSYFDLTIASKRFPCWLMGYKRIKVDHLKICEQFSLGAWTYFGWARVSLAAIYQGQQILEGSKDLKLGITGRFQREIGGHLLFSSSMTWLFDQLQYSTQLQYGLYVTGLRFGLGYEKLNHWNALNANVIIPIG